MIRAGLGVEAICAYLGLSRAVLDYNLVRLDLPTPHDRPRRKGGRRAWADDELRLCHLPALPGDPSGIDRSPVRPDSNRRPLQDVPAWCAGARS